MSATKELPKGITNPFSDGFIEWWDNWKSYRMEQHKFKYKGVFSEQAALMKLNDISGQNEQEAIEIIKESMANGWKGFFERKKKLNGITNQQAYREELDTEFASRSYANGGH